MSTEHYPIRPHTKLVCASCGVTWPCLEAHTRVARQPIYRIGDQVVLKARGGGAAQNHYTVDDVEPNSGGWLYTIHGPHRKRTAFEQDLKRA